VAERLISDALTARRQADEKSFDKLRTSGLPLMLSLSK
jgi:hypothetical protein